MPTRLKRYQHTGQLHYITFTCYHRKKFLDTDSARDVFEQTLERVRRWYGLQIIGYVVMLSVRITGMWERLSDEEIVKAQEAETRGGRAGRFRSLLRHS